MQTRKVLPKLGAIQWALLPCKHGIQITPYLKIHSLISFISTQSLTVVTHFPAFLDLFVPPIVKFHEFFTSLLQEIIELPSHMPTDTIIQATTHAQRHPKLLQFPKIIIQKFLETVTNLSFNELSKMLMTERRFQHLQQLIDWV